MYCSSAVCSNSFCVQILGEIERGAAVLGEFKVLDPAIYGQLGSMHIRWI